MIKIPDSLRSLFSATIERRDETYVIEVPASELDQEALSTDETYRVALIESASTTEQPPESDSQQRRSHQHESAATSGPPVDEGEVRDVTIETVGDQGDGIAKVERGYVVIVAGARPGDEPTVEIEEVKDNVAFASVIETKRRRG